MVWRFWISRRDRLILSLLSVIILSTGLTTMSVLASSVQVTVTQAFTQQGRPPQDLLVHMPLQDVLRPAERLDPSFITSLPPGIGMEQLEAVRQTEGVHLAAPVVVVGVARVTPSFPFPSPQVGEPGPGVYRLRTRLAPSQSTDPELLLWQQIVAIPDAETGAVPAHTPANALRLDGQPLTGMELAASIPVLVVGIDPEAEARLSGLDHALVSGRYLDPEVGAESGLPYGAGGPEGKSYPRIPVLLNRSSFTGMGLRVTVEELDQALQVRRIVKELNWQGDQLLPFVQADRSQASYLLGRAGLPLLHSVASPFPDRWAVARSPNPVAADPFTRLQKQGYDAELAPAVRPWSELQGGFHYEIQGVFDPTELARGLLVPASLEGVTPGEAYRVLDGAGRPANPPERVVGGISPSGYLPAPPALITTTEAALALTGDRGISLIRVKVEGVDELTAEAGARVRAVAADIAQKTGLEVTVTWGSAPVRGLVQLPVTEGSPPSGWIEQAWTQLHIALTVVQEATFGHVIYLALLFLVFLLYTVATGLTGVSARRRELGLAAALGWPARALALGGVTEQIGYGLLAGLLAWAATGVLGVSPAPAILLAGPLLYAPAALAVGVAAQRISPGAAINWGDAAPGRRLLPGPGLVALALSGLVGRPIRSALTTSAMALPTIVLVVLLFITRHLHGVLYTTITGEYAAVEVGSLQTAMSLIALVLAVTVCYDLVRQNAVDRRQEIALLTAIGWPRKSILLVSALEGAILGGAAGLVGSLGSQALLALLYGRLHGATWLYALAGAGLPLLLGSIVGGLGAWSELRGGHQSPGRGLSGAVPVGAALSPVRTGALLLLLLMVPFLAEGLRSWAPAIHNARATNPAGEAEAVVMQEGPIQLVYPTEISSVLVETAVERVRQAVSIAEGLPLGGQGSAVRVELKADDAPPVTTALVKQLVHQQVMEKAQDNAAWWLREGFARLALEEGALTRRSSALAFLKLGGAVALESLEDFRPPDGPVDDEQERAAITAWLLLAYLEESLGPEALSMLLEQYPGSEAERDGLGVAALEAASRRTLAALERDFHSWLEEQQRRGEGHLVDTDSRLEDPAPSARSYSQAEPAVRTQYKIDLVLGPSGRHLTGRQQVTYTNNGPATLDRLYFHLFPNGVRDAAGQGGSLLVHAVRVGGQPVPFIGGDAQILAVPLGQPLEPGSSVIVDLDWEVTVPPIADRFGLVGDTLYLGNFYPILAVRSPLAWHVDRYVPAGDPFLSAVADYSVSITVPDGYMVAATGRSQVDGLTHTFRAERVRDFAAAISRDWEVYERTSNGVQIRYYRSPQSDPSYLSPEAVLATVADALTSFGRQWGPYPYEGISVVDHVGIGMEYPQFIMAVPTRPGLVHEVAHQWWTGVVGNDGFRQIWDEGITEFAAMHFLAGTSGAREHPHGVTDGLIPLDGTLYQFASAEAYGTVYGRGWRLWESLRRTMGDAVFHDMVRRFYSQHQFGVATWGDWRKAVVAAGGTGAAEIFDSYVYRPELPEQLPADVEPPSGE